MGPVHRHQGLALIEDLHRNPSRFEFFEAVRLLAAHARQEGRVRSRSRRGKAPGSDEALDTLRFAALPSLSFPGGHVEAIRAVRGSERVQMLVSFLGAIGPSGVLPAHYTELVIKRLYLKDETLRDFLDIFHHRAISLFYQAWTKYQSHVNVDYAAVTGSEDPFSRVIFSLVGLGTPGLRARSTLEDDAWAFYSGFFSRAVRSASALESMLSDYLGYPVRVEQLVGRWLSLESDSRSRLSSTPESNALGRSLSLGSRVWDVQSRVRIHLGPLHYPAYRDVMRGSAGHEKLATLVRSFVGPNIDHDFRITVEPTEVPKLELSARKSPSAVLGRSTWMSSSSAGPLSSAGAVSLATA